MKILNALAIICLISQLSAAIKYCEKGIIGDKKCRDPTLCCSKWGNCGLGAAWCDVSNCVGGACWGTSTTLLTSSSSSTTKSITASTTVQQSSSSVISTNTQQSSSILQTTTAPGPTSTSAPASFVFSPYKDITVNLDWNTFNLRTKVSGTIQSVLSAIPSGMETLTWAFASGECGNELWAGVTPSQIKVNVNLFVNAGKKYIISTGGAAGVFTCGTDAGFLKFIETYYSANMVGVDFDIEGGLTQSQIQSLIQRTKFAQTKYPNLRFSFTVATLGGNSLNSLNYLGNLVVTEIKTSGLSNYYINLMTMDYGPASSSVCVLNASGKCDMGLSAIQAVNNFKNFYGIPYSKIEVTPMIGMNDIVDEIFSLSDAKVLTNFVKLNKLGGLHLWSFDRDTDCILSVAAPYCNSFGQGGVVGFTKTFLSELNFASQSTPSTSPSISPSSTLAPVSTSVASPSNTPSSSISGVSAQQQGAPCGFKSQGTLLQISDSVQICSPPVHCNPETCPPQLGTCVNNVCNYKAGYYGLKTLPQAWATYYCDLSGEGCHGVTQSEFPEITAKRVADAHNLPLCHQKLGGKCVGIAASSPMIVGNSQVATDSNGNFLEYWGLGFSEASDVCYNLSGPGGDVIVALTDRCGGYCKCGSSGYQECGPCVEDPSMSPNGACVGALPLLGFNTCIGVNCGVAVQQECDWCASNNHPHFDLDTDSYNYVCGSEGIAGSCKISKVVPIPCKGLTGVSWPPNPIENVVCKANSFDCSGIPPDSQQPLIPGTQCCCHWGMLPLNGVCV